MTALAHKPEIIDPSTEEGIKRLHELLHELDNPCILDPFIEIQQELVKINHPRKVLSAEETKEMVESELDGIGLYSGVWVHYPWNRKIIHLPEKDDFIKLRTARNLYKITEKERDLLSGKKVGIIGLSVGHSVAMNLALERSVGELRLADFDQIELSNLNRIRSNILNIGLPKVVVAARDIAELDPFLEVKTYPEGINEENIEDFLLKDGPLDILIEECDDLHVKILARQVARKHGIPVIMETSDRGMVDVERFDLDKDRPILHGLIEHLDQSKVKDLHTSEEKIPYLMPMVGLETMSHRLKASALEVGSSITTWPQLGTSVMLGGAILSDAYRRIMLKEFNSSGRFIVDPKTILKDPEIEESQEKNETVGFEELSSIKMKELADAVEFQEADVLKEHDVKAIVEAAGKAPSGGNAQPWKWLYYRGRLFLFLDKSSSMSFMDYKHSASYMALGSSLENAEVMASSLGFEIERLDFPLGKDEILVSALRFRKTSIEKENRADLIDRRYTDRRILEKKEIDKNTIEELKYITNQFENIESRFIQDEKTIQSMAEIISLGDWLRVMNSDSHRDFIEEEMRWDSNDLKKQKDGIFVKELSLSPNDLAGLYLVKDRKAVEFLKLNNYGQGLKHISKNIVNAAPLILTGYARAWDESNFLQAGLLLEKLWLYCTEKNIGFQIMNVPTAFLLRYKDGNMEDVQVELREEVDNLVDKMLECQVNYMQLTDLFTVRLFIANPVKPTSVRKDINQILNIE